MFFGLLLEKNWATFVNTGLILFQHLVTLRFMSIVNTESNKTNLDILSVVLLKTLEILEYT